MSTADTKRDDGSDAFPVPCAQAFGDGRMVVGGMTLRDYFAAKAMQSLLVRGWVGGDPQDRTPIHYVETATEQDEEECLGSGPKTLAKDAYRIADAMIAARKK